MSDIEANDNRELIHQIDFGMQVEAFLGSEVGKYLIGRAEQEVEDATSQLKDADPENPKLIRDLQSTIKRAESIQYWMAEAIQAGHLAQHQLREQDE